MRVPRPATGITAFLMFAIIVYPFGNRPIVVIDY
jgi:hypothetical protein